MKVTFDTPEYTWKKQHFHDQNGRCIYCGEKMVMRPVKLGETQPTNLATLEHLTPKSRGGANSFENTAASCFACNQAKGNLSHEEFIELRSYQNWRTIRAMMRRFDRPLDAAVVEHASVVDRISQMDDPNLWKSRVGTYAGKMWTHEDLDIALEHHAIKEAIWTVPYAHRFKSIVGRNNNKITEELLVNHLWFIFKMKWYEFKIKWTAPLSFSYY